MHQFTQGSTNIWFNTNVRLHAANKNLAGTCLNPMKA